MTSQESKGMHQEMSREVGGNLEGIIANIPKESLNQVRDAFSSIRDLAKESI